MKVIKVGLEFPFNNAARTGTAYYERAKGHPILENVKVSCRFLKVAINGKIFKIKLIDACDSHMVNAVVLNRRNEKLNIIPGKLTFHKLWKALSKFVLEKLHYLQKQSFSLANKALSCSPYDENSNSRITGWKSKFLQHPSKQFYGVEGFSDHYYESIVIKYYNAFIVLCIFSLIDLIVYQVHDGNDLDG